VAEKWRIFFKYPKKVKKFEKLVLKKIPFFKEVKGFLKDLKRMVTFSGASQGDIHGFKSHTGHHYLIQNTLKEVYFYF